MYSIYSTLSQCHGDDVSGDRESDIAECEKQCTNVKKMDDDDERYLDVVVVACCHTFLCSMMIFTFHSRTTQISHSIFQESVAISV